MKLAGETIAVLEKVPGRVTIKVTEKQVMILEEIRKDKFVAKKYLSDIVGISERKIKENIKKLKNKKMLKRVGPNRCVKKG